MHNTNYYETYPGFLPQVPPPVAAPVPLTRRERKRAARAARSTRRGRWTAPVVFILFLMLIGGTAAVLLALNYNRMPVLEFRPYNPFSPPTYQLPAPTAEPPLPATTIARAPTEEGVTLTLQGTGTTVRDFQAIYEKCIPSVVSILTTMEDGGASGTGVVLTENGYIVTNYHVIQGGSAVDVVLTDGKRYPALLVGGDQTNDLAVLKIKATGLIPAEFGNSDALRVGDVALAIGDPLGEELRGTMTDGIISATDRDVRMDGSTMTLIQTSAALNSGNSGGALLNVYGQVVGITNMKMMSYFSTVEGLGFAIPSTTAKAVVEELIATGYVSNRPTLGFTGSSLSAEAAKDEGLVPGVYVSTVDDKSDAHKQGLKPGDVVTECNGQAVLSVEEVNAIKAGYVAGDTLALKVYREGEYLDISIRLVEKYQLDD